VDKNIKLILLVGIGGVGVYLLYKGGYLQEWLPGVFGLPTIPAGTPPATQPTGQTTQQQPAANQPVQNKPAAPPVLDLTGLTVVPDINDSLKGTVKVNGKPTSLAIIQTDGRIFNDQGQEVTDALAAAGVDLALLRNAFTAAGAGLNGLGMQGMGWTA
jgi:hypothetical protein